MGLAKAAPAWLCVSEKAIFQKVRNKKHELFSRMLKRVIVWVARN